MDCDSEQGIRAILKNALYRGRKPIFLLLVISAALMGGVLQSGKAFGSSEDSDKPAAVELKNIEPAAAEKAARKDSEKTATAGSVKVQKSVLEEFFHNFKHNLFKPLLLFFYMGFLIPLLRVKFEFPRAVYEGLTMFLLLAIGWHGGEELASIGKDQLAGALGFMGVGFLTNFAIGVLAYLAISLLTTMRRVDKATVAGYYGSDSAGTFATCLGVLAASKIAFNAYMPVMLAVMEIPGCLVALYLVSRLRARGMDSRGFMPDEKGYVLEVQRPPSASQDAHGSHGHSIARRVGKPVAGILSLKLLHEVFLNPGLVLLFGGIIIGFVSRAQGKEVVAPYDPFFVNMFQGVLCLFLLEMGITAANKLKDLKTAGPGFIAFGLIAPNVFATLGICVACLYSKIAGVSFAPGTYVLFAVLCGSASYIAVPAIQRLAIPEASPTLPLAASLVLTFSYNVTIGIPLYLEISKFARPVGLP